MQTLENIKKLVSGVSFKHWEYLVRMDENRPYMQIKFYAPDNMTGEPSQHSCRKWMLSYHMTDDEIVSTAMAATLMAVEHETREQFKWEGQPVFRPHMRVRELHSLSSRGMTSKREET